MAVKKIVLSNNVVLLIESSQAMRSASLSFYFAAGSRFESEEERGVAHFVEHMLFKGTKTRTTRQIATAFDKMGGAFNAFTEKEVVCIYCSFPADEPSCFATAVDVLCDISEGCTFPSDEVERERGVIQSEIVSSYDDADECAMEELARTAWENQDLAHNISGTAEDVAAVERETLVSWYNRYIATGELVVAAVGRVFEDILVEHLSKLATRKSSRQMVCQAHFPEPLSWASGFRKMESPFAQAQIFTLFPMPYTLSLKEHTTLQVFNSIAGEAATSRLFYSLREESGLCYSTGSFYTIDEGAAMWVAYASCEQQNSSEVKARLESEVARLVSDEVTADEVELAKRRLCGIEVLSESRVTYLAQRLWNNYSMGFDLLETDDVLAAIRSVSREDVAGFARSILREREKLSFVYGPEVSFDEAELELIEADNSDEEGDSDGEGGDLLRR